MLTAKQAEEAYEQDVMGADNYNTYEMRQSFKRDNRNGSKYRYLMQQSCVTTCNKRTVSV